MQLDIAGRFLGVPCLKGQPRAKSFRLLTFMLSSKSHSPPCVPTCHGDKDAQDQNLNQVASLYVPQGQIAGALMPGSMFPELFPDDPYDMDKGWRPRGYVWALEGKKGGPVREWGVPPNHDDYMGIDPECEKRTLAFIRKNAAEKKPFYVAYWPQVTSFLGFREKETVSGGFLQEALVRMDKFIGVR